MVSRAVDFIPQRRDDNGSKAPPGIFRAIRSVTKLYVSYPALLSRQTAEAGVCGIVPARLQSLTIVAFVAINVVLCCVRYKAFDGNL
jgi:hypothetical protein